MNNLIGAWKLKSLIHYPQSEKEYFPMGADARGLLIYNADGFMAVTLSRADRQDFRDFRLFKGTDKEKIAAIESYVSYCGRYQVYGDRIVHSIELSLFPNWVGSQQERFYQIEGKKLIVKTPEYVGSNGNPEYAELIWAKSM